MPEARENVPEAMARIFDGQEQVRAIDVENAGLSTPLIIHMEMTSWVQALYDSIGGAVGFYPEHVFCKDSVTCRTNDGRIYYADDNHLAPYGGEIMVDALAKTLGWVP